MPSQEYYRDDRHYIVYHRVWPLPEPMSSEHARLYFSESRSEVVGSGNQGIVYRVRLELPEFTQAVAKVRYASAN